MDANTSDKQGSHFLFKQTFFF